MLIVLYCASCVAGRNVIDVAAGVDASEENKGNFIRMKTGKEVALPENMEVTGSAPDEGYVGSMKVNGEKINPKKIASFQINSDYFQNVRKNLFARRIYKGPFDVYQTSVQGTSTTTSSTGAVRSSSYTKTYTFLQKQNVNKGALYELRGFGQQRNLPLYVGSYQPSLDIYNKYRSQRHTSRIIKFATAGLWLSSIPLLFITKANTPLNDFAIYNAAAGVFYMPIVALSVKSRNHARPYQAVQKFIDNNYLPAAAPEVTSRSAPADTAPVAAATVAAPSIEATKYPATQQDFLEVNSQIVMADEGTKLRSANNKIFFLNGVKYTTGVSAYQLNKKFYKRFPDMKSVEDFAQRSINGDISVYNVARGTSQMSSNIRSPLYSASAKELYFEKKNQPGYIKSPYKLAPYFQDKPRAFAMYSKSVRDYRLIKITSLTTSVATLACVGLFFAQASKGLSSSGPYAVATVGLGLFNYHFTTSQLKKNRKNFVKAIDYYNGVGGGRGI